MLNPKDKIPFNRLLFHLETAGSIARSYFTGKRRSQIVKDGKMLGALLQEIANEIRRVGNFNPVLDRTYRILQARHAGRTSAGVPRGVSAKVNGAVFGGRPRQYPQCPRYPAHRFSKSKKNKNRCPCGYKRAPLICKYCGGLEEWKERCEFCGGSGEE